MKLDKNETIKQYDKRRKEEYLYALCFILFIAFQFWICNLFNIVV